MPKFIEEFKRRNVFRVATAYLVITWLVLQVADTAAPLLRLPEWISSVVFFVLALLFIPTMVFAWAFELTPQGLKRQAEVDRDKSITSETGKKLDYVTIGALVLVLLIVAGDRFLFPETPTSLPAAEVLAGVPGEVSIAVLPFADMSPNHDQDYFSDGISEEILNGLAKLRTMKVAGRTSSFAFKGRNEDLREIGAALGVDHVLEGSVRKDGDNLRITAQLIKVSDGFHLWSETYDRELRDVFAVQDEISAAIIKELQGNLLGDVSTDTVEDKIDVATFERYLAARKLIHARTNEGLTEARALLEQIVATAPDFAPGISSLAETLLLLQGDNIFSYGDLDPEMVTQLATPLLARAIELDPNLSDAYAVRGLMQYGNRQLEEAEASLLRAVELNPSSSKAWVWLSNIESFRNNIDKRRYYLAKAAAIDPLWLLPNRNLINVNQQLGQIDEVWSVLERLRPFHQNSAQFHSADGSAKSTVGELAGAYRAFLKARELSPYTPSISLQFSFTLLTLQDMAQTVAVVPPQMSGMKGFVTGEWDDLLPALRQQIETNPEAVFSMFAYVIGATFIGDFEGVVSLYDTVVESPEWITERQVHDLLLEFVPAMQALNRADDVELLLGEYHQYLVDEDGRGAGGPSHLYNWSSYLAMAGDYPASLDKLEASIAAGTRIGFWQYSEEYQAVKNDLRFIELQNQNLLAINAEREKLGWDPVAEVGIFYKPDQGLNELLQKVLDLELPSGEFAVFGSGPLLVRGVINSVNDIDIICRGAAWEKAQSIGELVYLEDYDVNVVSIDDGLITFGRSWGIGEFDVDELINTAEVIDGLPFVQLQHVIDYKRIANRPKDRAHLDLLELSSFSIDSCQDESRTKA